MEGVDDPGILKCVFMAGGPGSGKSFTASELFGIDRRIKASFSTFGLKIVSSDNAFEYLLHKAGINPKELANIAKANPQFYKTLAGDEPESIRSRARQLTRTMRQNYVNGRLGVIIDGTGDDYEKIKRQREEFERYGYDCLMVLVNTDLDVALQRNRARPRTLPDAVVREIWTTVQEQIPKFRTLFGSNFIEVKNNTSKLPDEDIQKAVRAFIARPVRNPIGREWLTIAQAVQHLAQR